MAISPPPLSDVVASINGLLGGPGTQGGLKGELDKNLKALVQSALSRLDVVSREEFDAQAEMLTRTRGRVEELEALLAQLTEAVEKNKA
jgi:ubiquinone biosynthesis accessory factor UbiK